MTWELTLQLGNSRFRTFPFPFPRVCTTWNSPVECRGVTIQHGLLNMALVVVETFTNRGGRFTLGVQGLHWTVAMQNHGRRRRPTKLLPSLEVIQVAASSICRCPTPSTFLDSLDSTQKCKKSGANLPNLPHAIRKKNNEIGAACMYFPLPCTWLCLSMTFPNREVCLRGIIRRSVSGVRFVVCSAPQVEKQKWWVCFGVCFATVELRSLKKKYYKPTHCGAVRAPGPASWMCSSVNWRAASALHHYPVVGDLVGLVASLKSFVEILRTKEFSIH